MQFLLVGLAAAVLPDCSGWQSAPATAPALIPTRPFTDTSPAPPYAPTGTAVNNAPATGTPAGTSEELSDTNTEFTAYETELGKRHVDELYIHMGPISSDHNDLTADEIEQAVAAVVSAAPDITGIAVAPYLDYGDQVAYWLNAIHAHGKKAYVRSPGFDFWEGAYDHPADGTPDMHIRAIVDFISQYHQFFLPGDIMEVIPDEASNGAFFNNTDHPDGVGTNDQTIREFNTFLQQTVTTGRTAFDAHGLQDVIVEVFHDNPSVIKETILDKTLAVLKRIGSDNYPPLDGDPADPQTYRTAMERELETYTLGVHPDMPWEITTGPDVSEVPEENQERVQYEALALQLMTVIDTLPHLHTLTLYPWGEYDNWPGRRLSDYSAGTWHPRGVMAVARQLRVG